MKASPEQIMAEARQAAQAESDASELRQASWWPCGFASITIRPARGAFVTYCKQNRIGSLAYGGGWRISSYDFSTQSNQWCQSMNVKEDATRAAAEVLRSYGINASVEARMD